MRKIAILVDLELTNIAGGHVKFWEKICYSIKDSNKDFIISVFFLGQCFSKKEIGKNITFFTLKPIVSSKILKSFGIDADSTDLFPINLKLLFKLKKYDLIHTTDQLFSMAKTAYYASKIWNIPLTTSLHTDTPSYTKYYVKKLFEKFPGFIRNFFIENLKLHHRVSEKQKIKMKNYLKFCEKCMINDQLNLKNLNFSNELNKKVFKLSRGVDRKIFKKKKINRTSLLKKYGISKNEKIIFFCGRVHELKGVLLISEIHKILEKEYKLVSILAGQNLHGRKCVQIGGKRVKVIGYVDETEISKLYNLCDLFVFPSKYEIGPQVVLEAKACGAIPIVSPSGGGKRVYKNGEDGIVVDFYNAKIWANEIKKLFKNKKQTDYMRKKILNEYNPPSWKEIFDKYFLNEWIKILK